MQFHLVHKLRRSLGHATTFENPPKKKRKRGGKEKPTLELKPPEVENLDPDLTELDEYHGKVQEGLKPVNETLWRDRVNA